MIEGKYIYDSIYENANQSLFFEVNVQSLTSLPEEIQSKKILKYAVLNPDTVVEPEVNKTTTITVDQISIMAEGPPFIRIKE